MGARGGHQTLPGVSYGELESRTQYGMPARQAAYMRSGYADYGSNLAASSVNDDAVATKQRAAAVGPMLALHPRHGVAFWMLAAVGGLVVLNGLERGKRRRKKK